jgi:hypothetical protein
MRLAFPPPRFIFPIMDQRRALWAALLAVGGAWGCEAFSDPTPENIFFELRGPSGAEVQVVYATQFLAGVNEVGRTEVRIFVADTVLQTLPIDTVVSIAVDRQVFIEVLPAPTDTLDVDVLVDVDDRNLVSNSGKIYPEDPWRFIYVFNQMFTQIIDVVL